MIQTTPFTTAEVVDIRRFCGYPAFAAFGYTFAEDMATLDTQLAGMSDQEQAVVRATYLPALYELETDIPATRGTLNVAIAGPFTRNKYEVSERASLFDGWRRRLCEFVGVRPGGLLRRGAGAVVRT